jgi:hypothetical protein
MFSNYCRSLSQSVWYCSPEESSSFSLHWDFLNNFLGNLQIYRCSNTFAIVRDAGSVINWPPGSGSVMLNYGSGSFLFSQRFKEMSVKAQYSKHSKIYYLTTYFLQWPQKCPIGSVFIWSPRFGLVLQDLESRFARISS